MKKKIITVCALITIAFASSAVCFDFQNDKGVSLSMINVEAMSARETTCFSSSSTKTGICKKSVNNTGDVCVTSNKLESNDCYSHGYPSTTK